MDPPHELVEAVAHFEIARQTGIRATHRSSADDARFRLADWITRSGTYEVTAPMAVPIVNFQLRNFGSGEQLAQRHMELVDLVTDDGQRWISEIRVQGQSVLRMMVTSYLTGEPQLAGLLDALLRAGRELHAETPK